MLIEIGLEVERLQHKLRALVDTKYTARMDMSEILASLTKTRILIARGLPFTPCECGPLDDCKLCEGRKWIDAIQYLDTSHPQLQSP